MKKTLLKSTMLLASLSVLMGVVPIQAQEAGNDVVASEVRDDVESEEELDEVPSELIGLYKNADEGTEVAITSKRVMGLDSRVYHITKITKQVLKDSDVVRYVIDWDVDRFKEENPDVEVEGPQALEVEFDESLGKIKYDGFDFIKDADASETVDEEPSDAEVTEWEEDIAPPVIEESVEEPVQPQPEVTEPKVTEPSKPEPVQPQPEVTEPAPVVTEVPKTFDIPFADEYLDNNEEYEDFQRVVREGVLGKKDEAGNVIQEPVNRVIERGTKKIKDLVTFEQEVEIPFTIQEVQDPNLAQGQRVVKTPGVKGLAKVTYTQETNKGERVGEPKEVGRVVVKQATPEVVSVGAKANNTAPINTQTTTAPLNNGQTTTVAPLNNQLTTTTVAGNLADAGESSSLPIILGAVAVLGVGGFLVFKGIKKDVNGDEA